MKAGKPAPKQAARPPGGQAAPRNVEFSLAGEYITLDNLLKIMGAAPSGGAAKALVAALEAMGLDDALVLNFYGDVADQIKAADPKDETGFGKAAAAKVRLETFQSELSACAQKKDFDAALVVVDKALKEGGFGTEETQQIMMTRAMIFAQQKKFDEALKAVDEAKAFAPDSEMAAGFDGFKAKLEAGKKAAETAK